MAKQKRYGARPRASAGRLLVGTFWNKINS
jgi:hypothetical protein